MRIYFYCVATRNTGIVLSCQSTVSTTYLVDTGLLLVAKKGFQCHGNKSKNILKRNSSETAILDLRHYFQVGKDFFLGSREASNSEACLEKIKSHTKSFSFD